MSKRNTPNSYNHTDNKGLNSTPRHGLSEQYRGLHSSSFSVNASLIQGKGTTYKRQGGGGASLPAGKIVSKPWFPNQKKFRKVYRKVNKGFRCSFCREKVFRTWRLRLRHARECPR